MNRQDRYYRDILTATVTFRSYKDPDEKNIIGKTYNEKKARRARKMAELFGNTLRELIEEAKDPNFYDRILIDPNRSLKDPKTRMRVHILSQGYFDEEQRRFVFNREILEPISNVYFANYHIRTLLYVYTQDPDVWSFKKNATLKENIPEYILMGANTETIRRMRIPKTIQVSARGGRARIEEDATGRAILIKAEGTKLITTETGEEITI